MAPSDVARHADLHDSGILSCFRTLFAIPDSTNWDSSFHELAFDMWTRQAQLPQRFGGCGLRNSCRISSIAFWTSWMDSLPIITERFPDIGNRFYNWIIYGPSSTTILPTWTRALVNASQFLAISGWDDMPTWSAARSGIVPPSLETDHDLDGEWVYGWQFHASNAIELQERINLKFRFAFPSWRRNAIAPGKARFESASGAFSSSWLTICPITEVLEMSNANFRCAVRRRLGLVVNFENDLHGHKRLCTNLGGRMNTRHTLLCNAWRQVFIEAGGQVPDRNMERMLRTTNIPLLSNDNRRLDLIVPGLSVHQSLPLFCDVTIVTPVLV